MRAQHFHRPNMYSCIQDFSESFHDVPAGTSVQPAEARYFFFIIDPGGDNYFQDQ